ncbi:cold-shock protein [Polycladidibacter hongkongensis]|uniref:cold-shock protein n=1 Tax=Polycladidibacter hongkongensis TaxID=1647556 RepID=UPI000835E178|nr:cold-shock protein [Pseudovibrio hongkongensis]
MHNGNSGRRPRNKRGGKREFGAPQEFGIEFGAPGFLQEPVEQAGAQWDNPTHDGGSNQYGDRGAFSGTQQSHSEHTSRGYPPRNGFNNGARGHHGGDNSTYRAGGGYGGGDRGGYGNGGGDDRGGYGNGGGQGNNGGFRRNYPPVERGPRQYGTVKFFKLDKGFGFITPDEGANDVFVHISAVERSGLGNLESGQRISFETEPDRRGKGPKAVELRLEPAQPVDEQHLQEEPAD